MSVGESIPLWRPVLSCYVTSVLLSPARWIFSNLSPAWEWLEVMIAALHKEIGKLFHFGRKGWGFRFSRGGKPSCLCVCSSLREHLLFTTNKGGVITDGKVGEPEDHLSPFFQGQETTLADYPPYELVATYEMTKAVFPQCCQDASVFSVLLHLLPSSFVAHVESMPANREVQFLKEAKMLILMQLLGGVY